MKVSYAWLRELSGIDASPTEVAERLTRAGVEVEAVTAHGHDLAGVVIAEVREVRPHPKKDKLTLVRVSDGKTEREVVCGAPNVPATGARVLLATVGARLPNGLEIAPREVAGVPSDGMLCSEAELGIGADGAGIVVLERQMPGKVGAQVADALGLRDHVLDLSLTPNRADCLGHIGVAREIALLYGEPFVLRAPPAPPRVLSAEAGAIELGQLPTLDAMHPHPGDTLNMVQPTVGAPLSIPITIRDPERCTRYLGLVLQHAKAKASPFWMRYRLHLLGQRSIDSVVDATNWILLETGHPIHAFDLDRLRGPAIVVRTARDGERLTTLDGIDRALSVDDLVIADAHSPVALAGVIGGQQSGVSAETRNLLLEVAYFEPRSIRRTARRHGLHTEASHRFERGADPGALEHVMRRAAALLATVAEAAPAPAATDTEARRLGPIAIELRSGHVRSLLGAPVPVADARRILEGVGCTIAPAESTASGSFVAETPAKSAPPPPSPASETGRPPARTRSAAPPPNRASVGPTMIATAGSEAGDWRVTAPSHRPDLRRPEDLIEEVARVWGYHKIPAELAPSRPRGERPDARPAILRALREAAVAAGLFEAVNVSFVSARDLELARAPTDALVIANPMSEERSRMRTSMLPGLLSDLGRAQRHQARRAMLFELGRTYHPAGRGALRPIERATLAILLAGPRDAWVGDGSLFDFWDGKGAVERILSAVSVAFDAVRDPALASEAPWLHPRRAARIVASSGAPIGVLGEVHPDVAEAFEVLGRPVLAVLDADRIVELAKASSLPKASPLPRFPAVLRDAAVVVGEDVTVSEVAAAIRTAAPLADEVELFDVYRGKQVADGRKSLAFRIGYRDPEATLTDARVEELHAAVVQTIAERFGGALR
jgi:phenylalanyl-tRNA synthetase beta chain